MITRNENFSEKAAQTKISKTLKSRSRRESRTLRSLARSDITNKKYCSECGFRIRSKNHEAGAHHIGTRIDHKRKT